MRCPHCGDETFVYENHVCLNPRCRKPISIDYRLEGAGRSFPLVKGNILRFERDGQPSAVVVEKPGQPSVLLIKNVGVKAWSVLTPSGKSLCVASGGFMPVKNDLTISTSVKFKINQTNK